MMRKQVLLSALLALVLAVGGHVQAQAPLTRAADKPAPAVIVEASYPGASAQVVADTVAAPLEQQVNGVEGLRTMVSHCTSDGQYTLTVTFAPGTDPDQALVLVQNRAALALPILPQVVQNPGIAVKKKPHGVLLMVYASSPGGRYDTLYLGNYTAINIKDELVRLAGVGAVRPIGARNYSMRIWLDPDKLAARKLTAGDVLEAINQQNLQVAGKEPPAGKERPFTFTVETLGKLTDPKEFGDIILKAYGKGRYVRLRDVACVELGAASQPVHVSLNSKPGGLCPKSPL